MTKRYKVSEEERLTEFCTHFWGLFMTKRLSSLRLFPSISQSGVISFLAPLVLSSKGYPVHSTSLPIHSIFCSDVHKARRQVLSFLSSPLLHQVVLVVKEGVGRPSLWCCCRWDQAENTWLVRNIHQILVHFSLKISDGHTVMFVK